MKRGDLITVAVSGDYGKPRPALARLRGLDDENGDFHVF